MRGQLYRMGSRGRQRAKLPPPCTPAYIRGRRSRAVVDEARPESVLDSHPIRAAIAYILDRDVPGHRVGRVMTIQRCVHRCFRHVEPRIETRDRRGGRRLVPTHAATVVEIDDYIGGLTPEMAIRPRIEL